MSATLALHQPVRPAPPAGRVGVRRHSERVYRRRRRVVGTLLAGLLAAGGVAAHDVLAGPGGEPASAAAAQPAPQLQTVIADHGDTLWSIARRHHGEASFDDYVDALVRLNDGASLQVGQIVRLP